MLWWGTVWWMIILFALLLWFVQNCQHEGAHCIAAILFGHKITSFRPWPGKTPAGHWSFAYMSHKGPDLSPKQRGIISAAPIVVNTIVLIALHFILLLGSFEPWLASLLAAYVLTNLVDGTVWFATFARKIGNYATDGWKVLHYWNLRSWVGRFVGIAWVLGWWIRALGPWAT